MNLGFVHKNVDLVMASANASLGYCPTMNAVVSMLIA